MGEGKRVVAFVVARLGSSRLKAKHLRKIGNKRIIDHVLDTLKKSKFVDEIVITTTAEGENAVFERIANQHGVSVFFYDGDTEDVVGRLNTAASRFKADICVLISGDCPLIWVPTMDKRIRVLLSRDDLDFVGVCDKEGRKTIHEGVGVYSRRCWLKADELSDNRFLRMHQFPVVGLRKDMFRGECVYDDDIFYAVNHRISVDTPADLEFMNRIYNELENEPGGFNLKNAVKLLLRKPELMKINADVHQIGLFEETKRALFVLKSDRLVDEFLKLAYNLTKDGIGVRFLLKDQAGKLKRKVEQSGYGVLQGMDNVSFDFEIVER